MQKIIILIFLGVNSFNYTCCLDKNYIDKYDPQVFARFKNAFTQRASFKEIQKLVDNKDLLSLAIIHPGLDGQSPLHYFLKTLQDQQLMLEDLGLLPQELSQEDKDRVYLIPKTDGTGYTQESLDEVNKIISLLSNTSGVLAHRDTGGYTPVMLAEFAGIHNIAEVFVNLQKEITLDALNDAIDNKEEFNIINLINKGIFNQLLKQNNLNLIIKLFQMSKSHSRLRDILYLECTRKLLTDNQMELLLYATCATRWIPLAHFLLTDIKNVNIPVDLDGNTFLHVTAKQNIEEIATQLIKRGANVNQGNIHNNTPLFLAATFKAVETARTLLLHGADINMANAYNMTPIETAIINNDPLMINLLLKYQTDINKPTSDHKTLLHIAAQYNKVEIARILLEHGADVNAQNQFHMTPLHLASHYNCLPLIELLLEFGANINAWDIYGKRPINYAFERGMRDAYALLALNHR